MDEIKIGDKYKWIGETHGVYTNGSVYSVNDLGEEEWAKWLTMSDDDGEDSQHWWDFDGLKEFFEKV